MAWKDKEKQKLYNQEYRRKYPEKVRKSKKRWEEQNKEYCIEYWRKYRQENKEIIKKRRKIYNKKYKEKDRQKRKTKRLELRFKILKRDNFTCQYCGRKSQSVELQIDHIYPKSKGGRNNEDNYQVLCFDCNKGKGDSILEEFNCEIRTEKGVN